MPFPQEPEFAGCPSPALKLTANAPENGWLEYFLVSFWVLAQFQGRLLLVLGSVSDQPLHGCFVDFGGCDGSEIAAPFGEATIIIHYLRWVLDIHLRVGQDFVHQHFHFLCITFVDDIIPLPCLLCSKEALQPIGGWWFMLVVSLM